MYRWKAILSIQNAVPFIEHRHCNVRFKAGRFENARKKLGREICRPKSISQSDDSHLLKHSRRLEESGLMWNTVRRDEEVLRLQIWSCAELRVRTNLRNELLRKQDQRFRLIEYTPFPIRRLSFLWIVFREKEHRVVSFS